MKSKSNQTVNNSNNLKKNRKKAKLQPTAKVKYRNFQSYDELEADELETLNRKKSVIKPIAKDVEL